MNGRRMLLWIEMTREQRELGVAKLEALARAKTAFDGTVIAEGWAGRVAPLLRYHFANPRLVWQVTPTRAQEAAGIASIFSPALDPTKEAA